MRHESLPVRVCRWSLFLIAPVATASILASSAHGEEAAVIEQRLGETAKYLSSDALEGRGIGTHGLDAAADFIAGQFEQVGLKTRLFDGTPFQRFTMTTGAVLGDQNSVAFAGPPAAGQSDPTRIELKLGSDFNPLALGGSGKFDLPLVFVGYGITGKTEKYDDYAGIDVKGKAVLILRHEPQQANPHSVFNGTETSEHAPFVRKISNAYEHGAAAVVFCNDQFDIDKNMGQWEKRWQAAVDQLSEEDAKFKALAKPSAEEWHKHEEQAARLADEIKSFIAKTREAEDLLVPFDGAGNEGENRSFPVIFCRRAIVDQIVQSAIGSNLAKLEEEIDLGPTPKSHELTGWRAAGQISVARQEAEVKNIVGVLEGVGPLAEETIVVGAHYDHLGFGAPNSASPGVHEIHNGADDNGSGTTVLLQVARELAGRKEKLHRRIVFIAFTGEERGLVGSSRYLRNPLFPLDKTVAMLNMDMVGRLVDDKLIVFGTGTAPEFDPLVDRLGQQFGFQVTKKPEGFGPSDHAAFYGKKIPVLHFFTGSHKDYHRPSDKFEKLNIAGMRRVGEMVTTAAIELAEAPGRPQYAETQAPKSIGRGGDRPYFGSIPDFSQDQPGYGLTGVTKDGPAERAGIRAGDIVVQFGDSKIGNLEDFDSALRKFKAGDRVPIVVKRGSEELKLEVTLDPPK